MNFRSDKTIETRETDLLSHQGKRGLFFCRETRTNKECQAIFKDVDRRKTGRIHVKELREKRVCVTCKIIGESF